MQNAILVGIGGFFGSIARYLMGLLVYRFFDAPTFPYATLLVNVLGCLAIGFIGTLAERSDIIQTPVRVFLIIGLLGGFTTFSAFGYETLTLARDGRMLHALWNIAAQIVLGLCAVWFGMAAAAKLA